MSELRWCHLCDKLIDIDDLQVISKGVGKASALMLDPKPGGICHEILSKRKTAFKLRLQQPQEQTVIVQQPQAEAVIEDQKGAE
jgi:hypothetical protein